MLTSMHDYVAMKRCVVSYDRLKSLSAQSFSLVTSRGRCFELEEEALSKALSWSQGEPLEIESVDRSKSIFIIRRVAVIPCQEIRAKEVREFQTEYQSQIGADAHLRRKSFG